MAGLSSTRPSTSLEISKGGYTVSFAYGPDRARYRRIDTGTDGTTTTRYIGSVEIIFHPDGTQERKRYLAGVAIESRTVTGGVEGGRTTHYVHKDHLGSIDVLTDASGTVVQELSFDAWRKRRDATDWTALSAGALLGFDHSLTTRGYTGHEMLDEVGLIHMNGRVYDPKLARFLQADPFIQDPTNSQSLNRYSYVWNNPLNATDPSGYFVFTLIAAAIWAANIGMEIHAVVALFTVAGFADTLLAGGSFKDALLAGISAGAFAALGAHLGGFTGFGDAVGDVMAMGVLGGVTTVLQGGKFGHGFRAAGLSSLTGGLAGKISQKLQLKKMGQGIARMVAAGTTSELTGGKFANGAASAAFSSVAESFGEALSQQDRPQFGSQFISEVEDIDAAEGDARWKKTLDAATALGVDTSEVRWVNKYAVHKRTTGEKRFSDTKNGALYWFSKGYTWLGGQERNGAITIYRTAVAARITDINVGLHGTLVAVDYNGHIAGLFSLGHELRHAAQRPRMIHNPERDANEAGRDLVNSCRKAAISLCN